MTSREEEILKIIEKDPLISQQEIAKQLKINRSSVAVHIGNLMKKGRIKGKGYIISEEEKVCVVGGANIDLEGSPREVLKLQDSNPGKISTSLGGVGRNIAENLARLKVPTWLLSAVGDDFYGRKILEESNTLGIDIDHILLAKNYPTSMYLSIMDENHDMKVAISQMDVLEALDTAWMKKKIPLIKNASLLCLDGNLSEETIKYVCGECKSKPIFVDPVSTTKAMAFKNVLGWIHTIKPNKLEAEKLLNRKIETLEEVRRAGEIFLEKGVKRVFITLGKEGVYAKTEGFEALIQGEAKDIKSATGAGDAFMAALIDSYLKKRSMEDTLTFAMASSYITLASESTISPSFSREEILQYVANHPFVIKIL